jgi:hypothetical protein
MVSRCTSGGHVAQWTPGNTLLPRYPGSWQDHDDRHRDRPSVEISAEQLTWSCLRVLQL